MSAFGDDGELSSDVPSQVAAAGDGQAKDVVQQSDSYGTSTEVNGPGEHGGPST
jgi:hypothetical protein